MQQALPAALQARGQLQQAGGAAADATYAASHSREFAATMRTALPASLHRMEAALRDASWAAAEVARRQHEEQGGAGSGLSGYLGGLLPQRLVDYWAGPGGPAASSPQGGKSGSGSDDGGMYR